MKLSFGLRNYEETVGGLYHYHYHYGPCSHSSRSVDQWLPNK